MNKLKRVGRIGALMKIFNENPNQLFSYSYFTEQFNAAKSSISEDISMVKELVEELEYGKIVTYTGANGGAKFIQKISENKTQEILEKMCGKFSGKDRVIPGGYIYMTDIFNTPNIVKNIGTVIASQFADTDIDYVLTVETKGIPVAIMTAQRLNVPVAVIRRNNKVTEGATVSINYISNSSKSIQTMSLSRRSLKPKSKVLIVDDFMKGGGTAKGMCDMMNEFGAEVVGTAVVVETIEPEQKMIKNYISLLILDEIDEINGTIKIRPNTKIFE